MGHDSTEAAAGAADTGLLQAVLTSVRGGPRPGCGRRAAVVSQLLMLFFMSKISRTRVQQTLETRPRVAAGVQAVHQVDRAHLGQRPGGENSAAAG